MRAIQRALQSMKGLKELYIRQELITKSFAVLAGLPLTTISFDKNRINQGGVEALSEIIRGCTQLTTLRLHLTFEETSTQIAPIFDAVLQNTSVRLFSCRSDRRFLDDEEGTGRKFLGADELESLIKLIESTGTLRELNLRNVFSNCTDLSQLLGALRKNSSIRIFTSEIHPLYSYWPDPTDLERTSLQNALLAMIRDVTTLQRVTIVLNLNEETSIFENELIQEAHDHSTLPYLSVQNRRGQPVVELVNKYEARDSVLLKYQAANLLKIGRLLSGTRLVCGKSLPNELVDAILRQVTANTRRVWDDKLWKVIRRVVLNRQTIGRLILSNDEPFDAYELLYRCRPHL